VDSQTISEENLILISANNVGGILPCQPTFTSLVILVLALFLTTVELNSQIVCLKPMLSILFLLAHRTSDNNVTPKCHTTQLCSRPTLEHIVIDAGDV